MNLGNKIENEQKSKMEETKKGVTDFMMWFIILFILAIVLVAFFFLLGSNIIKAFLEKGLAK